MYLLSLLHKSNIKRCMSVLGFIIKCTSLIFLQYISLWLKKYKNWSVRYVNIIKQYKDVDKLKLEASDKEMLLPILLLLSGKDSF